jgi:glycosyltransferase involved in cell wall biosynthesis
MPSATRWHLITGEYPPESGGVADYSAQLAAGLASEGHEVHVWCPLLRAPRPPLAQVNVHEVPDQFGRKSLRQLQRGLDQENGPSVLLLQYAPNALGLRGMNVPLCLWLLRRSRSAEVRVVFHEPFFYFGWRRPRRNVLALVQRLMAVLLLASAHIVYLSSETWKRYLRRYAVLGQRPMIWLPIPATVLPIRDPEGVARLRGELTAGRPGGQVIGHFGTYAELVQPVLSHVVPELLRRHQSALMLCLGTNSERFVEQMVTWRPELAGRIHATGYLAADEVSLHLQACDLALQPYPDGVTTRRTSLMAALAHGLPTVTTDGELTEPIWLQHRPVALAPVEQLYAVADQASGLLADEAARRALGERGRRFYADHLSLARAIEVLTSEAGSSIQERTRHLLRETS